ncbi:MAG: hypothetical protein KDA96_10455 [Planctomycetaceae bacterium]|nr:hypothetical protein [Planctomycetaceae bacterium]
MKRTDFISAAARLEDALKQLEFTWMATREHWSDSVSRKVEDEYLVTLHGQVRSMLDAVGTLSSVMRTAQNECLHRRERGVVL